MSGRPAQRVEAQYLGSDHVDLSTHSLARDRALLSKKLLTMVLATNMQQTEPVPTVSLTVTVEGIRIKHPDPAVLDKTGSFHPLRRIVSCQADEPCIFSLLSGADSVGKQARFHAFRCLSMAEANRMCLGVRSAYEQAKQQPKHQTSPHAPSSQRDPRTQQSASTAASAHASGDGDEDVDEEDDDDEPMPPVIVDKADVKGGTAPDALTEDTDSISQDASEQITTTDSSETKPRRRRRLLFRRRDSMTTAEGKPALARPRNKSRPKKVHTSKYGLVTNKDELEAVISLPDAFPMFQDAEAQATCYMCMGAVRPAAACCQSCLAPLVDTFVTRGIDLNDSTQDVQC
ncbi:hypothetical protein PTSG_02042 [Salpingoeca rosetta]|uniref:PID domain-containing protein n=1 Tax=Salpingoeca rosetta (strain ATCC 50818 / BSB-021) TaxID=946362 RepID=F2TZQ0_SALR5|nr:uncharacterized protein PTSG_02042 [Salpingoeca rosetta]EGD79074.1 hypothetical protein PTSG_02042 [Salpingoeca rosetta]|eukprot:XP_004998030.1 hypothetical protein PTSG_02042 [Salpingoeca rosetta]